MADVERGSPGRETVGEQAERNVRQSQGPTSGRGQNTQIYECCGRSYEDRESYGAHRAESHDGQGSGAGRRERSL